MARPKASEKKIEATENQPKQEIMFGESALNETSSPGNPTTNPEFLEDDDQVMKISTQSTDSNQSFTKTVQAGDEFEEANQRRIDLEQFTQIAKITGRLTKQVSELSLLEQKEFDVEFNQWVKDGKKLPQMPKIDKAKVAAVVDIFVLKDRGVLKMYHDTDTPDGHQVGRDGAAYTQVFDADLLRQWQKEQEELNGPQQRTHCYLILDGVPHTVHPEALFQYDETATLIKEGKYHY